MTIKEQVRIARVAREFCDLYMNSGLINIYSDLRGNIEVHLEPKEFYKTFGNVEYEYKDDRVQKREGDITYFTLLKCTPVEALK